MLVWSNTQSNIKITVKALPHRKGLGALLAPPGVRGEGAGYGTAVSEHVEKIHKCWALSEVTGFTWDA